MCKNINATLKIAIHQKKQWQYFMDFSVSALFLDFFHYIFGREQ